MQRLQKARTILALCAAGWVMPSLAGGGLKVDPATAFWSAERSNLRINALSVAAGSHPAARWGDDSPTAAATVLGDYYFSVAPTPQLFSRSNFRASSGLLIRQPGVSLSDLALSSRSAATFGVPSYMTLGSVASASTDSGLGQYSALPYVGLGYTGIHAKGGWGFWADVGLVMQSPGNILGVGRLLSGAQSAEDLMRDLRLSPMLQLGVNYSF